MKTVAVRIDYDPDTKTYGATSDELRDVFAVSNDRDDVLARFVRATHLHLEALRERGEEPRPPANAEFVTVAIDVDAA